MQPSISDLINYNSVSSPDYQIKIMNIAREVQNETTVELLKETIQLLDEYA